MSVVPAGAVGGEGSEQRVDVVGQDGRTRAVALRRTLPRSARPALEDFHADHFPVAYTADFFDAVMSGVGFAADGGSVAWALVAATPPDEPHTLYGVATGRVLSEAGPWGGMRRVAYVSTIAVVGGMRGCGLGSLLLDAVLGAVAAHNVDEVRLHVLADNTPALTMYYKHGFTIASFISEHYAFGGALHDAFLLTRPRGAASTYVGDARRRALADAAAARTLCAALKPSEETVALVVYVTAGVVVLLGIVAGTTWVMLP